MATTTPRTTSTQSHPAPTAVPQTPAPPSPPLLYWILGFLAVGLAWGFTTPFIRRAAQRKMARQSSPTSPSLPLPVSPTSPTMPTPTTPLLLSRSRSTADAAVPRGSSWLVKMLTGTWAFLCDWEYVVPLTINLSGSVWFFLLLGQAELSLMVPIVNTMAFLFTVIGEWWVENKMIGRETALGMALSLVGIGLCVHSKI